MDSGLGGGPEGCETFSCWGTFGQQKGLAETGRPDKTHPSGRNDTAVVTMAGLSAAVDTWGRTRFFFVDGAVAVHVVVVVVVAAAAAAAMAAATASVADRGGGAAAKEEEAGPMAIGAGAQHHAADDQGRKEDW